MTLYKRISDDLIKKLKQNEAISAIANDGFLGYNAAESNDISMLVVKIRNIEKSFNPQINNLIEILEHERSYFNFFHFQNLKNNNNNFESFYKIKLDENEIKFTEDKSKVIFKDNDEYSIIYQHDCPDKINIQDISTGLITDIQKGLNPEASDEEKQLSAQLINLCDIVFFEPGTESLLAVPIPFASTPTSVLITSTISDLAENTEKEYIMNVFAFSKYYNDWLLKHFLEKLDKLNECKTFRQFILWFANNLATFLLPIKYSINHSDTKGTDIEEIYNELLNDQKEEFSEFEISLEEKGYTVKIIFKLKSYKICEKCEENEYKEMWVHETKDYGENKENLQNRINAIFNFTFQNWKTYANFRKMSLKSSTASVLSRNLSHNIGAHVLNKLSEQNQIDSFLKLIKNGSNFSFSETEYEPSSFIDEIDRRPRELFRVFNSYLKNRMDFIADVATSEKATLQTNKRLFSEIVKGFEKNQLLLKYITGKEKFKYRFKFKFNGISYDELGFDPLVAIPNDVLGDQAFYIILENIIRNSAKHSVITDGDLVTFTIEVNDLDEMDEFQNLYRVSIYDDIKHKKNIDVLVNGRNKNLALPILDSNDRIRSKGWGTIEIKLATCYLRNIGTSEIDSYKYGPLNLEFSKKEAYEIENEGTTILLNDTLFQWEDKAPDNIGYREKTNSKRKDKPYLPLVQAIDGIPKDKTKGFGYYFFMKKPEEVLIVDCTEEKGNYDEATEKNLLKEGIKIVKFEQIDNIDTDSSTEKPFYNHQFVLYYFGSAKKEEIKPQFRDNLPQRIYYLFNKNKIVLNLEIEEAYQIEDVKDIFSEKIIDVLREVYLKENNLKYDKIQFSTDIIPKSLRGSGTENIIFMCHGGNSDFINTRYFEPFSSSSLLGYFIEQNISSNKVKLSFHALEAALTEITIIDERVQSVLYKDGYKEEKKLDVTKYWQLFAKTGIEVPSKKNNFDLNSTNLLSKKKKIFCYIQNCKSEFLVIHFGIIESLRDGDMNSVEDVLKEVNKIKNKETKLIITSGRGKTPDIPKTEYFVSFSAFSNYILDPYNRSKIHLVNLLKSTRK